jgi:hypothetical protein
MLISKVTKYDDIFALAITLLFGRYIGRDLLGLHIDLSNIVTSMFLVAIFILAFFYLIRVSISLLLGAFKKGSYIRN